VSTLPPRVGRYERTIEGSLERVLENVHDWEHLPWLHRTSFRSIALLEAGDWGWRARVGLPPEPAGPEIEIELRLRPGELAYDVTTLAGPGSGTVIATRLRVQDPETTGVEVGFHVPAVGDDDAPAVGQAYATLYERLWNEDQVMIAERTRALTRPPPAVPVGARATLGPRSALAPPLEFGLAGRRFRLVEHRGELLAHDATCPHRLGPLLEAPDAAGELSCPWHGYRFDVRTGRSTDGCGLRLLRPPRVRTDPETDEVTVTMDPQR
jgi:nitrite reductase/ring-hydroxylating ferredoxin subunit